jgi:hypothetical protein
MLNLLKSKREDKMDISEKLYRECWQGSDSPQAVTAFLSGQSATYETADSEHGWRGRLIKVIEEGEG